MHTFWLRCKDSLSKTLAEMEKVLSDYLNICFLGTCDQLPDVMFVLLPKHLFAKVHTKCHIAWPVACIMLPLRTNERLEEVWNPER